MKKCLSLLLLMYFFALNATAQDDVWRAIVTKWEKSKEIKPKTVTQSKIITAHGTNGDENKGEFAITGEYLQQDSGKFKINVNEIKQKSGVTKVDGDHPTKDKFDDPWHVYGNSVFAAENQDYINAELNIPQSKNGRNVYIFESKIPGQEVVMGEVIVDKATELPLQITINKSKQNKSGSGKVKISVNYLAGKVLVEKYKIEGEINFFGAGATETAEYTFNY